MKLVPTRLLLGLIAAVGLAVPASAWGHGSVYTDTARVDTNPAAGQYTLADQVRHVITNHGFTYIIRETNGATDKGMVDYSRLPGDYRSSIPGAQVLAEGDTAAQPHATCRGVAALETDAAIRGWQETDPFYNYVPFQKTDAGLEDHPADWIEDVLALTGIDLSQVSDVPATAASELELLCESSAPAGLGGTFVPADGPGTSSTATIASATRSFAEGVILPLEEQIEQYLAEIDTQAQSATTDSQTLRAEITQLKLEATTLRFQGLGDQKVATLTGAGSAIKLQGPAGKSVKVRMLVRWATARKLRLKSRLIAEGTGKIGDDATASVQIKATSKAASALKRITGSRKLSVEARAADRIAQSAAKIGK